MTALARVFTPEEEKYAALYPIAVALRRGRALYCVSLRDMAERAGVSASLLCRIENAQEKPSERVLKAYSDNFRMTMDELLVLAGRVPADVVEHLANNPSAVKRLRAEMKEGQNE